MRKELIITADDFGLDSRVNAGVREAFQRGILRYASLMVDRPAAEEAVAIARELPGLGVGLHLDLCRSDPALWGWRYFAVPEHRRRLEPEIRRQIEKMLAWGLRPTHADGHCNIHVHPVIFPILARLSREYGIPRLRLPGGEANASRGARSNPLRTAGLSFIFGTLRLWLKRYGEGLEIPGTWGLLRSGTMNEEHLLRLLERLPDGATEIYFHPSADEDSAVTDRPTPGHHTVTELRALTSPRVRELLKARGIGLREPPPAGASR